MSYIALYRKWRPAKFDDLVGQDVISKTLKSQIKSGRIAHAYLFSGGRGTGKTSTAKIFSRAVNCINSHEGNPCNECEVCQGILNGIIMDVIEIDAASNNSVDDVRAIRDEVFYTPSVAKYRVYIIDEVHMLSTGAFNALLKILEEPPNHVIFLLATTEPHKLPATILSRCQKFEFRQIGITDIVSRLKMISDDSKVQISQDALDMIAKMADGALRDAISILDQCMDDSKVIDKNKIIEVVGLSTQETLKIFAEKLLEKDSTACIDLIDEVAKEGKDISQFISLLILYFRDLLVYKSTGSGQAVYLSAEDMDNLKELSAKTDKTKLIEIILSLSELENNLRWSNMPRVMFEVEIVKLCSEVIKTENYTLKNEISKVETPSNEFKSKPVTKPDTKKAYDAEKEANKENLGSTFEDWGKVLARLKSSGKMVLYSNLMSAQVTKPDEKTIMIKSVGSFGKTLVSTNENMNILKEALKQETGQEMNIKFADDNIKHVSKAVEQDKSIDKVTEMAKNLDIPFNIIEE